MDEFKQKMEQAVGTKIPDIVWWRGLSTIKNWLEDSLEYDDVSKIGKYLASGDTSDMDDRFMDEFIGSYKGYFANAMNVSIEQDDEEQKEKESQE